MSFNYDLDPRYRKAVHEDFKEPSEEMFDVVRTAPGGWVVGYYSGAISVCFVPFPFKYVLKEKKYE